MTVRLSFTILHIIAYLTPTLVPLGGNRRRFGPVPVEESAPPQLAQPSPSAYPRPREDSSRNKEDHPSSTSTPSLGKPSLAHSLGHIVHIGDSVTLYRILE